MTPRLVIFHPDDDSSAVCYNERFALSFMGLKYECLKLCIMNNQQLFIIGIFHLSV